MKEGPYTLVHSDRGSIQWWAWAAAAFGLGCCAALFLLPGPDHPARVLLGGFVLSLFAIPLAMVSLLAVDFWRYRRCR